MVLQYQITLNYFSYDVNVQKSGDLIVWYSFYIPYIFCWRQRKRSIIYFESMDNVLETSMLVLFKEEVLYSKWVNMETFF